MELRRLVNIEQSGLIRIGYCRLGRTFERSRPLLTNEEESWDKVVSPELGIQNKPQGYCCLRNGSEFAGEHPG